MAIRFAAMIATVGLTAVACVSTTPSTPSSSFARRNAPTTTVRKATTTTVRPVTTVAPTTAPVTAAPTTAAPTTTTTPPTATPLSASTKCSALTTAGASSSARKYAANTSWNLPAACFGTHSDSARWAANWFNNAHRGAYLGDASKRGHLTVSFGDYSNPIYDAANATYRVRVFTSAYSHNLGADRTIPWNPAWEPATGNDQEMIIIDRATGREWGLWLVQKVNFTACITWDNLLAGYSPGNDLCVGQALVGRNPDGSLSDFRKDSGSSQWAARGLGAIQPLALLPTLDEIESGAIHHAVNNEVYNPLFGGACSSGQMGTAAAGVDCGYAVAPATRFERLNGPEACGVASMKNNATDRAKTVPEGTRFALDLSDAEIDSWLTSRGYTGAKRSTARIFAVALRDYGWIVSDSTCYDSNMAVEGVANPQAAQRWAALGVTANDGPTLLDGLIRGDRIRTLQPPSSATFINLA